MKEKEFEDLKGLTLKSITGNKGDKEIVFETVDGIKYKLLHYQDCCESVLVEDICGELEDLIDSPILLAEEVSHDHDVNPDGVTVPKYQDSFTWTFYKLATMKGAVTIRWYGKSNGWYSEDVDFYKIN